jgi:hypothetical protein
MFGSDERSGPAPADVRRWNGVAVPTPNQSGVPLTDTTYHRGSVENALISGRRDVNAQVVADKTGYGTVRPTVLATFTTGSIGAGGHYDVTISLSDYTKARVTQFYPSGVNGVWGQIVSNSVFRIQNDSSGSVALIGAVEISEGY